MFLWQLELGEHAASLRVDEELGVGLDGHLDLGGGDGCWQVQRVWGVASEWRMLGDVHI